MRSLHELWIKLEEAKDTVTKCKVEIEAIRKLLELPYRNIETRAVYASLSTLQKIIDETITECGAEEGE